MMHSVLMMSSAGDMVEFEPGLEFILLEAVPALAGVPEVGTEGTDLAGVPGLGIKGAVEPAGAGVSPPAAEVSTDIERRQ
jgi:hypothetical protein